MEVQIAGDAVYLLDPCWLDNDFSLFKLEGGYVLVDRELNEPVIHTMGPGHQENQELIMSLIGVDLQQF